MRPAHRDPAAAMVAVVSAVDALAVPTASAASASEAADRQDAAWTARILRTLAGVFVVTWSYRLSGYLTFASWLAIPVAVLGLAGLVAVVSAWLPGDVISGKRQHQIGWAILAAALVALALWSYFQIFISPDYGTDEIAFDQYAAQLVLHGLNPYLHSMGSAFPLFHVSPNGYTFKLNGQPITSLSYPALSFEAYLPLLALGITTQAAVWVDVAAWGLGAVLLYAFLPRRFAALAVVVVSLDVFTGYAVGGVTDFLYVPLLVGAAIGWDKFASTRGVKAWRGPVLMGLAMAVKQTPWLIVPFVVAGIVIESRNRNGWRQAGRDGARYCGIAAAAFLVPNIPYVIASPGAWVRGILTPMTSHAVPAGQGLISLSLSLPVGGGSLRAYNLAAIVVLAATFACFVAAFPALKPAAFLIPSIVLFFASRSFGSYLVMLLPSAIAAAVTVQRAPAALRWIHWRWVVLGSVAASVLAIALALTSASPLTMSIASVRTTGQLATVDQLTVTVSNNSDGEVRPAFTVQNGISMTAFWRRLHGPPVLAPHSSAKYTIEAPSYFAMPSISNGFQVLAFTSRPPTVSRTGDYVASLWRVVLEPSAINGPVSRGEQITVRAHIVNRVDKPMHVANVPVYLGQVTYAQKGLQFSQATVNTALPGQTPVKALTNSNGVATFTIHSSYASPLPVYFEANLVNPSSFFPYGYSPILVVRFR